MNLVKVISAEFDSFVRRVVKVTRFGKVDTVTALETSPFGIDSNPLEDMIAVYSDTSERGKTVLLGYINKNQIAAKGETRIFSKKANGDDSFYIHLKNNEVLEMGGTAHNLVRYTPLNTALQSQVNLINAELVKIAAGIATGGGAYTPQPISLDISASKIEEIKTL